LEDGI